MKNYKVVVIMMIAVLSMSVSCQEKERIVLISTDKGDIKVKLYNETPKHRDNFIKLVEEGFYDSLLFHRVINEFMIQGGDPESKNAAPGQQLGNGGPGYKIDAEIIDGLFHKKGVLAAAREGDQVNPEKKSSGSQFYIVQGKVFENEILDKMEEQMNMKKKQEIVMKFITDPANIAYKEKADSFYMNRMQEEIQALFVELEQLTKAEFEASDPMTFSEEQRNIYSTIGGTPHLDGGYTVFGEVIEGLEVIDSIAVVAADRANSPTQDIRMKMKVLK